MTEAEKWMLGCTIVTTLAAIAGVIVAVVVANKKQETVISPQPLDVKVIRELHEQFADKKIFEEHAGNNTARHAQLFNRIDEVEREARESLERRFAELNRERQETLEKLNTQFTFIREHIAAINRDLQIREHKR